MAVVIDGVLKEWGDRLYYIKSRARSAPKSVCGHTPKKTTKAARSGNSAGLVRAALKRTVRKAPEVMVKITSGQKDPVTGKRTVLCKDMRAIKAHFDYISRNGEVTVEDERGNLIQGRDAVEQLRKDWQEGGGYSIPAENGHRREAYSIILSMPPGTDREAVKVAAREFAAENFTRNEYVFAAHDDEDHPHVHLCVKTVGRDLTRLNPRKNDLQAWRESFAEKLRDNGIEANATPRMVRGIPTRAERQELAHIEKRKPGSSYRVKARAAAVERDVAAEPTAPTEYDRAVLGRRKTVVEVYGKLAGELAKSADIEDRKLAVAAAMFVQSMPAPLTAHRAATIAKAAAKAAEKAQREGQVRLEPSQSIDHSKGQGRG